MTYRVIFLIILPGFAGLALVAWGLYSLLHKVAPDSGNYAQATVTVAGNSFRTEVADTVATRERGLSGRPSMQPDQAMLFIFPISSQYSFWMKDMHFALDIVWIKDGVVRAVTSDVQPPAPGTGIMSLATYAPPVAVDRVLEVVAGTAARYGWKEGDAVEVVYN